MKTMKAALICCMFLSAVPAFCAGETAPGAKQPAEAARREAMRHYSEGLKYYQNADYEKAKVEWNTAANLDPENADVKEGLSRLGQQQNADRAPAADKGKKADTRKVSKDDIVAGTVLDAPRPGYRGEVIEIPGEQLLYVKRGDRVDVLVTFEAWTGPKEKQERELITATILQNVFVLNVRPAQTGPGLVELMLNPIEAQFLALSVAKTKNINLVRRSPEDTEMNIMEVSSFRKLIR